MNSSRKWGYGIGVFTLIFVVVSISFRLLDINDLPSQISGTLFEVVITAIITVFLLNGQSASEEKRDKGVLVFEKKQEVYHNFLEHLKQLIMDGEITIATQKENPQETIDELKDLLFELGYVQLHTSEENTKAIFKKVAEIIQILNDFESEEIRKQKELPHFYSQLSAHLFEIIAILKADLYGKSANSIEPEMVKELLESCDLFVDSKEPDRYELQNYFWDELQNQLLHLGYQFKKKDFADDVYQYYARVRNRHRYFGLEFPIYTTTENKVVNFRVELENNLYYGPIRAEKNEENQKLQECMAQIPAFSSSAGWFGWKWFDRNDLNFWNLESPAFVLLQNPRKRERLIREIAEEMDLYIRKIQEIANEKEV